MANVVTSDKKAWRNPSYRKPGPHFDTRLHSLIVDAQGASNKQIRTESGTVRFENGVAMLPADSRAKDVMDELKAKHALHPNQYAFSDNRRTVNVDATHRYFFGSMPEMPWKRNAEDTATIREDGVAIQEEADEPNEPRDGHRQALHRAGDV